MQPEPTSATVADPPIPPARHRTGLITILFTDLVGSTALKQQVGDRTGASLMQQHHALVRELLREFPGGEEVETAGDSFLIVFTKPSDAVHFGLRLHARLRVLNQGLAAKLEDRIGIHVGEVVIREQEGSPNPKGLMGIQVDTCARVMGLAQGGQILLTRSAFDNARQMLKGEDVPGVGPLEWLNHGPYSLKGIEASVEVCEVGEVGIAPLLAPAGSDKAQRQVTPESEPVLGWRPALGQFVPNTRWRLETKLGEGGFGEVWLGRNPTTKERRVFKFCFQAERVRFLKRELTLFRLLKERIGEHPNLVRLHDVYLDQPPFYVEMDYVEGADLRSWCEGHGGVASVPLETRLEIVAQAADGLQAAHEAGIIHRDIKPANILIGSLRSEAGGPRAEVSPLTADLRSPTSGLRPLIVKLTDFGIGQVVSEEYLQGITRAGFTQTILSDSSSSHTGTQLYMAPELLAGKPATIRSDIYSLGVVLYQLVVGDFTSPVTGDWSDDIADALLRDDLQHCLAGKPGDRFAGAGQLAKHLRALPERQAALARQQAALVAREKAAYRRGMLRTTMAAALVVAVISLLAIYALTESRQARSEARRADLNAQNAVRQRDLAQRSVYDADMFLAFQALDGGNLGHARELMRKHLPQSGEADLRGWEWRYLWQQCRGDDLFTLNAESDGHAAVAAFFPDGRTVAAASWRKPTVKLFDLESRRLITTLTHSASVEAMAVSPDGKLLASGCKDGTIRLWDAAARQVLVQLTNAQALNALLFSGDGRLLAWSDDERAVLWDVAARRERFSHARHLAPLQGWKAGLALSADSGLLAFGREDGKIEVWDWQDPSRKASLEGHQARILTLAFSPDGRKLVSGDNDAVAKVWEMSTSRALATLTNHSGWVGSLSFSPDGKTLATAGADQTVRLWNTESWEETTTLRGHEFEVWWVAYSPDGRRLITASRDGTLRVWDARARGERKVAHLPLDGPHCFSPNGQFLLRVHTNATFSVTDTSTLREMERRPWPITTEWAGMALSNDRKVIALGFPDGSFKLLDASTGHDLATFSDKSAPARRLDFSPDGSTLAVIKGDRDLWRDQVIEVWDMATRRQTRRLDAHSNGISRASFSPDSRSLALSYYDGVVELWDLTTGRKRTLVNSAGKLGAAYSNDGRTLATAGWDPHIRLWEVETGKELAKMGGTFSGFASPAFSGDGRRLAVGVDDGTVALWDLTGSKPQEVAKLNGGKYFPYYVSLPPGGNSLISRSDDGLLRVWRAPSFAEIAAAEEASGKKQ